MKKFEEQIVNYFDRDDLVVELYYEQSQWAEISIKDQKLKLKIYSNQKNTPWRFSLDETLETIKLGKKKLSEKSNKNDFLLTPAVDPEKFNRMGQEILEKILNHPEKKTIPAELKRFGKVLDIFAPGMGGARYTVTSEFLGFLEPED